MDLRLPLILIATVLDGAAALAGGLIPSSFLHRHLSRMLAFAAGTLISVAFLDLLPEALQSRIPVLWLMLASIIGFGAFYLIEQFFGSHASGQSGHRAGVLGSFVLVGDALHNVTDGVAIAVAFLSDIRLGILTSLAVIIHELPQEIGDYSILIAQGYRKKRALFWLFVVQCTAIVGALAVYWVAHAVISATPILLALSSGGFLYIAAADLLPELQHHRGDTGRFSVPLCFFLGIAVIAVFEFLWVV